MFKYCLKQKLEKMYQVCNGIIKSNKNAGWTFSALGGAANNCLNGPVVRNGGISYRDFLVYWFCVGCNTVGALWHFSTGGYHYILTARYSL